VKILFLTGCLESGRDGVGDYTRALAAECTRFGHETFLLSLNDPWLTGSQTESAELRLGARMSWPDRVDAARAYLTQNGAEIVSLQFVPYSFHPTGLNFALPQIVRALIGQTRTHCMFHEIWIGSHTGAPLQAKVLGFCQRKTIQAVVKTLTYRTFHTSNIVYAQLLARYGIDAKLLPLFGSVPVVAMPNETRRTDGPLSLGLFGSVHQEWNPDEMLAALRKLGRPIRLSHVGRIGPGESVWRDLSGRYQQEIEFCRLGEQSLENISQFLGSVDFGVATTPLSLIGKSSCTAAMLDHGLPVIVNRNDIHFRGIPEVAPISELLIPFDENFLERLATVKRRPPRPRLPLVAAQFLNDLGA
jgi:glycosyltransferase involved in cell wall biosynthesis